MSDKLQKTELIERVAETARMSKKASERVVNALFKHISESLAAGVPVQIVGFGKFEAKDRAARRARHPQTGAELFIKAERRPAFYPGNTLKELVKVKDAQ